MRMVVIVSIIWERGPIVALIIVIVARIMVVDPIVIVPEGVPTVINLI